MKKAIVFSFALLMTGILKAQTPIPGGPSLVPFTIKQIIPGTYEESFTILSSYANKMDSTVRVAIIINMVDSANNNPQKTVHQMNRNFIFPASTLAHNPPTRQDIINQVASTLGVQLIQ
jgi:hypothetical protein